MQFPCLLYKVPGPHKGRGGVTYKYVGCPDAEAFERLSSMGWHASKEEASTGKAVKEVILSAEAMDDDAPATRDELEQKARELGLRFHPKISDDKLAERIAGAM